MGQLNPLKSFTQLTLGERVDRATANITTGLPLFNVLGGRIAVNLILGEVTTVIETKTVTLKLQANPTTGATVDMCGTLDLSADPAGTLYTIAGAAATALQRGECGSVIGQSAPVIVAVGAIEAVVGDTHTGSIKWSVFYTPIDDGAYVEAA
jgi:hypothetical protein